MTSRALAAVAALTLSTTTAAFAALALGAHAPDFTAQASIGGRVFTFSLADALRKGPVVLYFYPAAFTAGCTIEAHDFAEHIDDFHRLGATVIGVSSDNIEKLVKFSISECRSKFAVAADERQSIAKEYGTTLIGKYDNRTSFVIARDGKIAYEYTSLNPAKHVSNLLAALRRLN